MSNEQKITKPFDYDYMVQKIVIFKILPLQLVPLHNSCIAVFSKSNYSRTNCLEPQFFEEHY